MAKSAKASLWKSYVSHYNPLFNVLIIVYVALQLRFLHNISLKLHITSSYSIHQTASLITSLSALIIKCCKAEYI